MQIVRKHRGKVTVLEHLGSAHTEAELTALLAAGDEKLTDYGAAEQLELELGLPADTAAPPRARTVVGSRSSVLIDAITESWKRLGFADVINDNAFFRLVLARLVEPTSPCISPFSPQVLPNAPSLHVHTGSTQNCREHAQGAGKIVDSDLSGG
ncbi:MULTISPECIES: hypothetical protein [Brevibacterium]|uniref:hypothetical protein n=1 Tax=Brevibacterium TaxID=1696 RepID=UPI000C78642C|nr:MULTISPECIES: hypothetical protein [Brevibacterium]HCG54817.1 hypothetical protein [Brevibacterium sp.]